VTRAIVQLDRWAIIVTGSRSWHDVGAIRHVLCDYPVGTIVLHGGAEGADTIAHVLAVELYMVPVSHPYFRERGRAGGVIRNGLLAELLNSYRTFGYQTQVEAFKLRDHVNVGTSDMCERAISKMWKPRVTWGTVPGVP
jgi:hypothetical protein